MCFAPIQVKYFDEFACKDVYRDVPCGKCAECARSRQNSWYQRIVECLKANSNLPCTFFTLTYDEAHVPWVFDPKTGEAIRSLCRADVLRWKKICQTRYYRLQEKYPHKRFRHKLTWFIVPEYGGHTGRPHYHGLCVGINSSDFMHYFLNVWRFGASNGAFKFEGRGRIFDCQNLHSGYKGLARYLAKYLSKPDEFDWSKTSKGLLLKMERPRVCCTTKFGYEYVLKMRDFHLAGHDVEKAVSRMSYHDDGFSYNLSRYYYNHIFGSGQKITELWTDSNGLDHKVNLGNTDGLFFRRAITKYKEALYLEKWKNDIELQFGETFDEKVRNYELSRIFSIECRRKRLSIKNESTYSKDNF